MRARSTRHPGPRRSTSRCLSRSTPGHSKRTGAGKPSCTEAAPVEVTAASQNRVVVPRHGQMLLPGCRARSPRQAGPRCWQARMIDINGSAHSGTGTVVRHVAAYAALTGPPVRVRNARARRQRPGLRPRTCGRSRRSVTWWAGPGSAPTGPGRRTARPDASAPPWHASCSPRSTAAPPSTGTPATRSSRSPPSPTGPAASRSLHRRPHRDGRVAGLAVSPC